MAAILGIAVYLSKWNISCFTASNRLDTSRYLNSEVMSYSRARGRLVRSREEMNISKNLELSHGSNKHLESLERGDGALQMVLGTVKFLDIGTDLLDHPLRLRGFRFDVTNLLK
jgi:hypothetical protein